MFGQSDYTAAAGALVRIGATSGDINEVKLGKELEEVLTKLIAMNPASSTSSDGNVFSFTIIANIMLTHSILTICTNHAMLTSFLISPTQH